MERKIQPSRFRGEVPDVRAGKHLRTAIERQALGDLIGVDAGLELAQRRGETLQVLRIARGRDVGVLREARKAVESRREGTDQHELDLVPCERREEQLRI